MGVKGVWGGGGLGVGVMGSSRWGYMGVKGSSGGVKGWWG